MYTLDRSQLRLFKEQDSGLCVHSRQGGGGDGGTGRESSNTGRNPMRTASKAPWRGVIEEGFHFCRESDPQTSVREYFMEESGWGEKPLWGFRQEKMVGPGQWLVL